MFQLMAELCCVGSSRRSSAMRRLWGCRARPERSTITPKKRLKDPPTHFSRMSMSSFLSTLSNLFFSNPNRVSIRESRVSNSANLPSSAVNFPSSTVNFPLITANLASTKIIISICWRMLATVSEHLDMRFVMRFVAINGRFAAIDGEFYIHILANARNGL